jgi:hypothetical protein
MEGMVCYIEEGINNGRRSLEEGSESMEESRKSMVRYVEEGITVLFLSAFLHLFLCVWEHVF